MALEELFVDGDVLDRDDAATGFVLRDSAGRGGRERQAGGSKDVSASVFSFQLPVQRGSTPFPPSAL
jgi:hypothetical protein